MSKHKIMSKLSVNGLPRVVADIGALFTLSLNCVWIEQVVAKYITHILHYEHF